MFRNRFVAREYSTDSTKLECISLMLEELGIKLPLESSRLLFLFPFFFQVHIPKAKSENKTFQATIQFEPSEILDVYEKYNLERQGKFFMDPICNQKWRNSALKRTRYFIRTAPTLPVFRG